MGSLLILTVVCMFTYAFEIVFGLAGTIMMVLLLSSVFESKLLVVYSVLPQILVGLIGLGRSPRTVRWSFLGPMLGFAAVGAVTGLLIFRHLPEAWFHRLLATVITIFGLVLLMGSRHLKIAAPIARAMDTLAGASQALFGISGPIAMTRLLSSFHDKTVIRNYALAFFLSLNFIRLSGYLVSNTFDRQVLEMMLISGPPLALTLWFANALHFRVHERWFRKAVAWVILAGGLFMLLQGPPA